MTKDEQIKEMAKDLGIAFQLAGTTRFTDVAEILVNAGWCKTSDVIDEIFEELAKATGEWGCYCITSTKMGYLTSDVHRTLSYLRKKHTEGANEQV